MLTRFASGLLLLVGMAGCAVPPPPPPPGLNHPANPEAAEAPLPRASDTLATNLNLARPTSPPPDESGGPETKVNGEEQDMPSMTHGSSIRGMQDMAGMDGIGGMQRTAPATGGGQ